MTKIHTVCEWGKGASIPPHLGTRPLVWPGKPQQSSGAGLAQRYRWAEVMQRCPSITWLVAVDFRDEACEE